MPDFVRGINKLSVILLATVQPLSRQDTTTINIKRHERNNLPKL